MNEYGITETNNFQNYPGKQKEKYIKILMQTVKDLKDIKNNVCGQCSSAHSSNLSLQSKENSQNTSQQHQQLKSKYNEMVVIHQEQRKEYQIRLAEKNQQIQILENLLRSQYLKQIVLQGNVKHLLRKRVQNAKPSQISQNMKNSIILGVYNREQGDHFRNKSKDDTQMRLEDMLKQPSSPRIQSQRVSHYQNNVSRADKLKSSLMNLNGLKRYFGNDSKFKQDVLDM